MDPELLESKPMPVAVTCSACNVALEVDVEHLGWRVRCPKCEAIFVARSPGAATPVPAGGPSSPYAQTWTPPGGWAGAPSPPPALSAVASPASPPVPPATPGQAAVAAPTGSFDEIFCAPIPAPPGAPMAKGAKGAFVLGILSLACFHLLTGIPAILVGYKARHRVRASGGQLAGDNLALAGMIMGAIGILLTLTDGWTPWSLVNVFRDPIKVEYKDDRPRKERNAPESQPSERR